MMRPKILIIDDRATWSAPVRHQICRALHLVPEGESGIPSERIPLGRAVFGSAQVHGAEGIRNDITTGLESIREHWECEPDEQLSLLLLDLHFATGPIDEARPDPLRPSAWPVRGDDAFGLRLLREMAGLWPDPEIRGWTAVPVVALSTRPVSDLESALNRLGNRGYIEREDSQQGRGGVTLHESFAAHLFQSALVPDGALPHIAPDGRVLDAATPPTIIGREPGLLRALRQARQAACDIKGCLIFGEQGTGKELFAEYIRSHSDRRNGPFETINCAAIPAELVESELFGYDRGAFTGASQDKLGRFELADGGVVFLDEIAHLAAGAQAKLLRVLQSGELRRVGSKSTRHVDVRVISATNRSLTEEVSRGRFASDLLHGRLDRFIVTLPPLRERLADVVGLFHFFLERERRNLRWCPWPKSVDPEVRRPLQAHLWPGNVRELQNVAGRVLALRRLSHSISPEDVEIAVQQSAQHGPPFYEVGDVDAAGVTGTLPPVEPRARGALAAIIASCAMDVSRELEAGLARSEDADGIVHPTTAMKYVLGRKQLSAAQAATELLKIERFFGKDGFGTPRASEAMAWAARRRRGGHGDH